MNASISLNVRKFIIISIVPVIDLVKNSVHYLTHLFQPADDPFAIWYVKNKYPGRWD